MQPGFYPLPLVDEVACMANTPDGSALIVGVEDKTGCILGRSWTSISWGKIFRSIAIAGRALAVPGLIDLWPRAEGSHTEFLISLIVVLTIGAVLFFRHHLVRIYSSCSPESA